MNRRSFFKLITGFVGGVVAAFAPGKTKITWAAPVEGIPRRKGTEYPKCSSTEPFISPAGWSANEWAEAHNNTVAEIEKEFELMKIERRINPPIIINKDGSWKTFKVE